MKNYEGHLYYYEKKNHKKDKLKGNRSKINSNVQIN